tara:strand:- start:418 stop:576 length:159 start_codon:yes stop_codon:yes gene_type:complete
MKLKERPSKIDYDFDCPFDKNKYYLDLDNYADYAEERIIILNIKIQYTNNKQ